MAPSVYRRLVTTSTRACDASATSALAGVNQAQQDLDADDDRAPIRRQSGQLSQLEDAGASTAPDE